ncbi:MAG: hypothetical protein ACRDNE_00615 [Gaiellaceae bacterium]
MSLIASRVGLRHHCTIERDSAARTDDWGNPAPPSWSRHLIDVPCRAWTEAAREPIDDAKTVAFEDRRLALELGTDLTESDQVAAVTDHKGKVIFEGPMSIEGILNFADHTELLLERIR